MTPVIDVHSHIYPDWYLDFFTLRHEPPCVVDEGGQRRLLLFRSSRGQASGPPATDEYTDLDHKIAFMDTHGIDCSIVSLGNPWLDPFDADTSLSLAREANARVAQWRQQTSQRIVGMGILPAASPPVMAEVAGEVGDEPGLSGIISGPRIGGMLLDDARLEPVWDALESGRVPLMIHPVQTDLTEDLDGYSNCVATGVAFPFVTTVAIARLVLGGVLERHPDLRVVAAHGGGALPFLVGRLEASCGNADTVRSSVRRLLLDACLHEAGAVSLAVDLVGAERVLFGTDHPFGNEDCARTQAAIAQALAPDDSAKVLGTAAASWYGLADLAPEST